MAKGFVSKGLHTTQTVRFRASLVAAAATDVVLRFFCYVQIIPSAAGRWASLP